MERKTSLVVLFPSIPICCIPQNRNRYMHGTYFECIAQCTYVTHSTHSEHIYPVRKMVCMGIFEHHVYTNLIRFYFRTERRYKPF